MNELVIEENNIIKSTVKRIDYIDIVKGITIILMIIGHVSNIPTILRTFIFSFHMPLFFIISGYTFKKKKQTKLLKSSIRRLIIPYLLTGITMLILNIIISIKNQEIKNILNLIKNSFLSILWGSGAREICPTGIQPIGAIWFLLAMFWGGLIFNSILQTKRPIIWILIISYTSYLSVKLTWLPLDIQQGMFSVLFMYIGYIMKKDNFFDKKLSFSLQILMLGIWTFSVCYGKPFSMVSMWIPNGFLNIVSAVCGTYFIVKLSQIIEKKVYLLKQPLINLGQNTLLILCVHLIILNYFPWNKLANMLTGSNLESLKVLIFLTINIILSLSISMLLNKIKLIHEIFHGNKIFRIDKAS